LDFGTQSFMSLSHFTELFQLAKHATVYPAANRADQSNAISLIFHLIHEFY
jgi:hypothetical protein